ncbi:hypothetical protein BS78_07G115700 [Paspalum vaginatum]|nr:hypothetical protein BS78_07G115700 [Paspalum vaginatum]
MDVSAPVVVASGGREAYADGNGGCGGARRGDRWRGGRRTPRGVEAVALAAASDGHRDSRGVWCPDRC